MRNIRNITFDERKCAQNLKNRGLDFSDMVDFEWRTAMTEEDTRYVSLGFLNNRLVVSAWCYRNKSTRIISLRKANDRERKFYEKATH